MIYFIQEVGLFRNRIKIGYTDNVRTRLRDIQTCSPSKLKILLVLTGDREDEYMYQQRFSKYYLHGEWFRYGIQLRLFIWINQFRTNDAQPVMITMDKETELITGINEPEMLPVSISVEPDERTLQIIDLWKQHKNWSRLHMIINEVQTYPGGSDIKRYKSILDEWGIEYD